MIVEELAVESADYSSELADSNAEPPKNGVWVRAFIGISEWGDGELFI